MYYPVIRDYDGLTYFREWSGGLMAGGFEPVAKPTFHDKVPPNFQFQLLPDDWDHFRKLTFKFYSDLCLILMYDFATKNRQLQSCSGKTYRRILRRG